MSSITVSRLPGPAAAIAAAVVFAVCPAHVDWSRPIDGVTLQPTGRS